MTEQAFIFCHPDDFGRLAEAQSLAMAHGQEARAAIRTAWLIPSALQHSFLER